MNKTPPFTIVRLRDEHGELSQLSPLAETVSRPCPSGFTNVRLVVGDPCSAELVSTGRIQDHCDGCMETRGARNLTPVTIAGEQFMLDADCAGRVGTNFERAQDESRLVSREREAKIQGGAK